MTNWKKFSTIAATTLLAFLFAVSAYAADVTLNLVAEQVNVTMADGAVVPMWGLRDAASTPGTATVPGPTISAVAGDNLIINLTNNLSEPTSLVINGQKASESGAMVPTWTNNSTGNRTNLNQRVRSFTHEASTGGGIATYRWDGLKPGTYLLESGSHQAVQIPMGLYAAVKVDVAPGAQAYPEIAYNNDVVLLFSEVDPVLNAAVASGEYGSSPGSGLYTTSMGMGYLPRYFLINGQSFRRFSEGGTVPLPAGFVNGTTLVRFLNAGSRTRNPVLQGPYMTLVAEDGNPLPYPLQQYSVYLPAAKTMDVVFQPTAEGRLPLYDRSLGLTNGTTSPGGMLTYLDVGASGGQVIAPNGGEVLISGDTFTVQWNGGLGAVRYNLWYSLDNGTTWNWVAAVGAVTSYDWTVPAANSTTSLFRVVGFDAGDVKVSSDRSNAPFTIAPRTSALLVTPNGGEELTSGDVYTVQWKSPTNATIGYQNLWYSLDNGATWNWIHSVGPNKRSFDWTVPAVAASAPTSLLRVDVFNPGGTQISSDVSDGNFTILPRANVLLTAPNGGETLTSGNNFSVQWKAPTTNPVGYYGLWYSLDNGTAWNWIGTVGGLQTSYNWTVPAVGGVTPTSLFRVRTYSSGGAILSTDISDGSFTIQP